MQYKKLPLNKGFTLLEILLAVVLLTFGIVAVVSVMSKGLYIDTYVNNKVIALNLAQDKVEEIKAMDFADIADEALATVSGFTGYTREVDMTALQTDLKKVVVNVYWEYKGVNQAVTLVTLISKSIFYEG